jgi:5-methylcytosine-specific restriction endonuclease McrA
MATRAEHAKRKGRSGHWISAHRRLAVYIRDDWTCGYCDRDLQYVGVGECELDHLIPRSRGGTHDTRNLILVCVRCNAARRDRPWRAFARKVAGAVAVARILRRRRRVINVAAVRRALFS